jgi:hypothetical protein
MGKRGVDGGTGVRPRPEKRGFVCDRGERDLQGMKDDKARRRIEEREEN